MKIRTTLYSTCNLIHNRYINKLIIISIIHVHVLVIHVNPFSSYLVPDLQLYPKYR